MTDRPTIQLTDQRANQRATQNQPTNRHEGSWGSYTFNRVTFGASQSQIKLNLFESLNV